MFKDKPGGLIVDYVGIAESLKALKEYTESDQAQTAIDTDKAVELMLMKYDVIQDMYIILIILNLIQRIVLCDFRYNGLRDRFR